MRIVLDTSALVSAMTGDADADLFGQALLRADRPAISALTLSEARTVLLGRRGPAMVDRLHLLLRELGAEIHPFDADQAELAFLGYQRFGKGHPARLNLVDCAAYALAKSLDCPLLFKGSDFSQTDVVAALPLLVPDAGAQS